MLGVEVGASWVALVIQIFYSIKVCGEVKGSLPCWLIWLFKACITTGSLRGWVIEVGGLHPHIHFHLNLPGSYVGSELSAICCP